VGNTIILDKAHSPLIPQGTLSPKGPSLAWRQFTLKSVNVLGDYLVLVDEPD